MAKDFEKFSSNPSNLTINPQRPQSLDPNINYNDPVKRQINEKYQNFLKMELILKLASMCFFAPLFTMQVSLQLSVLPHREKYHDTFLNEKRDLIKAPNEITIQDRRRYELIVKSGVTKGNMPFRAPVYSSYREVFRGLMNQGFLGFYKGNLAGAFHLAASFFFKKNLVTWFKFDKEEYFWKNSGNLIKMFFAVTMGSLTDLMVYPFMTMQSRFILQNRLPNFFIYKGTIHFFQKHKNRTWQLMQGWRAVLPYNICLVSGLINFSSNNKLKSMWIGHNIASLLCYPFITVMRRLQCQSELPGMIPERYRNVTHCFKLMMIEEGVKGFYRGYAMNFIISNSTLMLGIISNIYYSKYYYLAKVD